MKDINVEQIMSDIRSNIKEKGLKASSLKFCSIPITSSDVVEYGQSDKELLEHTLYVIKKNAKINMYYKFPSKGIKLFIKKVIRRIIRPVLIPNIETQETFNLNVVDSLRQMSLYISQLEDRIRVLENRK